MREILKNLAADLTQQLETQLQAKRKVALKEETERFKSRLKEVEKAMKETSLEKIKKEVDELLADMQQLTFLPELRREQEERLRDLNKELELRLKHYQELLNFLQLEQSRVLEKILPKRYSLRGQAQVFPVTVEIRLPEVMQ